MSTAACSTGTAGGSIVTAARLGDYGKGTRALVVSVLVPVRRGQEAGSPSRGSTDTARRVGGVDGRFTAAALRTRDRILEKAEKRIPTRQYGMFGHTAAAVMGSLDANARALVRGPRLL